MPCVIWQLTDNVFNGKYCIKHVLSATQLVLYSLHLKLHVIHGGGVSLLNVVNVIVLFNLSVKVNVLFNFWLSYV